MSRIILVTLGVFFGLFTSVANHGSWLGAPLLSFTLGNGWAWFSTTYLATRTGKNIRTSFLAGISFILSAVVAYYITDSTLGTYTSNLDGNTWFDPIDFIGDTVGYSIIGTITTIFCTALGAVIRKGGVFAIMGAPVAPLIVANEAWSVRKGLIAVDNLSPLQDVVTSSIVAISLTFAALIFLGQINKFTLAKYVDQKRSKRLSCNSSSSDSVVEIDREPQ